MANDLGRLAVQRLSAATHIEVQAEPRYWEDASVNGVSDDTGDLIPCRSGDCWCPYIELATGRVENWPVGTQAVVHYKVCDQGTYFLIDATVKQIAQWKGSYVPGEFLCHGDSGYGDYIILNIDGDGLIANYRRPHVDPDRWELLATPETPHAD